MIHTYYSDLATGLKKNENSPKSNAFRLILTEGQLFL